jgi:hypothetical protein
MSLGELFPQAGLEGLYHLEDTADSSGNARTLTNNGSTTFVAARLRNGCDLGTSNSTHYFTQASAMGVNGTSITMMCWVKMRTEPSATAANFLYQGQTSTSNVTNRIRYTDTAGTKTMVFRRERAGTANDDLTVTITALGTTLWHHVAYTYDGTNIRGYLDGRLIGTSGTFTGNGGTGPLVGWSIGATPNGSQPTSAYMDECACYSVALSSRLIANIYSSQVGRYYNQH